MLLVQFFSSEGMDIQPNAYMFTLPHLIYVVLCVIAFYLLMRFLNTKNPKVNKIVIITSIVLLLVLKYAGEALFIYEWYHFTEPVSSYSHPFWDFRTFISFQVCGVNNVLLPIVVMFNIKPMKDFVYTSSVIGGLAVLLYPVGVLFGDPLVITFPIVRTLTVHFLLIFLPLYLYKIGDFKLEKKNWKNALIGCLLVMVWAMFGNLFVDTNANNMFLMENPFLNGPVPFLNILPNGVHVIFLLLLTFLGYLLLYKLASIYHKKHPAIE